MRNQSTNKAPNHQKSQLQQANDALVALKSGITPSDRQVAQKTYSEFTIVRYLSGRGTKLDTAVDLLTIFRKRIEDRAKLVANAVQT